MLVVIYNLNILFCTIHLTQGKKKQILQLEEVLVYLIPVIH